MTKGNVGKEGLESLRINGVTIDNLPLGQGNEAKAGLADFLVTDRKNKEEAIRARYPTQNADYIKSRIRESKANQKKIKEYKEELKEKKAEYRRLIKDASTRENELSNYDPEDPDYRKKVRELDKKYPPYKVEALEEQIDMFDDGIDRCDEVIEQEYDSISELEKLLELLKLRDRELANIR